MEIILRQTEDENDFRQYKLCNSSNETHTSFDVELNRETALISYETDEKCRNKGYASRRKN